MQLSHVDFACRNRKSAHELANNRGTPPIANLAVLDKGGDGGAEAGQRRGGVLPDGVPCRPAGGTISLEHPKPCMYHSPLWSRSHSLKARLAALFTARSLSFILHNRRSDPIEVHAQA